MIKLRFQSPCFDCSKWKAAKPSIDKNKVHQLNRNYSVMEIHFNSSDYFVKFEEKLFSYQIFPADRMDFKICSENNKINTNSIIIQSIKVALFRIDCAVRAIEIHSQETLETKSVGFSYITLEGHPESGVSKFLLTREKKTQKLFFSIETYSSPGHWFFKILSPISRFLQKRSTREALMNFSSHPNVSA